MIGRRPVPGPTRALAREWWTDERVGRHSGERRASRRRRYRATDIDEVIRVFMSHPVTARPMLRYLVTEARDEDELLFLGAAFIEDAFDIHGPWVFEVIEELEVPEATRQTLRRGTFRPRKARPTQQSE